MAYPYDVEALRRREYPWEARGEAVHFDHASLGVIPQRARDAVAAYNDKRAEMYAMRVEDFFSVLDRSRDLVAQLIGASAQEIALTTNTSWGVNLAAYALPLGPGDIVLGSEGEFPANVYPWMSASKMRGFSFELLPMAGFEVDEASLLRRIETDPRVKGVALSWVSFWSGNRIDAASIGTACRKRGIWFALDAIQGLGPCVFDVRTMPVDILSCGAQKWLCSPWGAAFAYVRKELIAQMEPPATGWLAQASAGDFGRFLDYDPAWRSDAQRFEVGSLPIQDFVGLNGTLELMLEIGPQNIQDYVLGLSGELWNWAAARPEYTLLTRPEHERRGAIVAFRTPDVAADSARLRAAGVVHSVREGALRLAPHFHNLPSDLSRVVQTLES
jgi:selenocysteine lyase/cysteine desulfurase